MWRREWSIVTAARLVGEVLSVWMSTIESEPCTDAGTPLVPGHRNQSRERTVHYKRVCILYKVVEKFGG